MYHMYSFTQERHAPVIINKLLYNN